MVLVWLFVFILPVIFYFHLLSRRLHGPHPLAKTLPPPTAEELSNVSYTNIQMLKAIPNQPTQLGYAVIGGSGFLGTYIVRLLLLRGEKNIRILDLQPPPEPIASNPQVFFIRTDITSLESVRDGLLQPFQNGEMPRVIYHTAAIIRIWDRASYLWPPSRRVNVDGVANVIQVAKELPFESVTIIYTSTGDVAIPPPKFMRLGWDLKFPPHDKVTISDEDPPLDPRTLGSCYSRSKWAAEQLIATANGQIGLKTGIIRPAFTIVGPGDSLITSTMTLPRVPVWDKEWSASNICVWDAAAAHLCLEDALSRNPDEASERPFLVSGSGPALKLKDIRNLIMYYSKRSITLQEVPPILIYIFAHMIEALLFARYYLLMPFFSIFRSKLSLTPKWLGGIVTLQPSTFEYMTDVHVDDSRARKILGYRPQWNMAQSIKYVVEGMQSNQSPLSVGLSNALHFNQNPL